MATIMDYLNKIKTAIYGKDVRQAIHDAIQQVYYDGKAGSIDLEARQDFNDFVNYGAKNFLENTAVSKAESGVVFTVNSDKSVTVNGTPTADVYFVINPDVSLTPGERITINGCPEGGGDRLYMLGVWNSSWAGLGFSYGSDFTITVPQDGKLRIRIKITGGVTVNNLTFKPMIRPVYITDPTYVPYGMTNAELTEEMEAINNNVGKNSALTTTAKDSLVSAVNEVNGKVGNSKIRRLSLGANGTETFNVESGHLYLLYCAHPYNATSEIYTIAVYETTVKILKTAGSTSNVTVTSEGLVVTVNAVLSTGVWCGLIDLDK